MLFVPGDPSNAWTFEARPVMITLKNVLVATDFSEASETALT